MALPPGGHPGTDWKTVWLPAWQAPPPEAIFTCFLLALGQLHLPAGAVGRRCSYWSPVCSTDLPPTVAGRHSCWWRGDFQFRRDCHLYLKCLGRNVPTCLCLCRRPEVYLDRMSERRGCRLNLSDPTAGCVSRGHTKRHTLFVRTVGDRARRDGGNARSGGPRRSSDEITYETLSTNYTGQQGFHVDIYTEQNEPGIGRTMTPSDRQTVRTNLRNYIDDPSKIPAWGIALIVIGLVLIMIAIVLVLY